MNSTGYRIILLLVVGMTAFSSAMKELNQVQQLSLEATQLISQWSDKIVANEVPAQMPTQMVVKLESCESEIKQSTPSVELPWLSNVADEDATEPPAPPAPAHRATPGSVQLARLKKMGRLNIDPVQFEVRIASDPGAEPDETIISELPLSTFKAKARGHGAIRISPRDREILLKTANRSISLRIAS